MAIGGLAVRRERVPEIVAAIKAINKDCGVISEVKWSTAKKRRVSVHKRYVDYLFDLIDAKHAHFHIRFAPFSKYSHTGERGRVDTVSKMYYQMILHRPVAFYGKRAPIYIHPDHGDCTSYLPTIRGAICAAGYRTKGAKPNCVREIITRDSRREPLLQLLDVPLGALTALRNERELQETKAELAAYVLSRTGWTDLAGNSRQNEIRLNLWNANPRK